MPKEAKAIATIPADPTAAARVRPTGSRADRAAQKTLWTAVTGGIATAGPPTGGTVTTRLTTAIARLAALHTAHRTDTGPPTAPAITPQGATATPRTLTAATPLPRDITVATANPAGTRPRQRK